MMKRTCRDNNRIVFLGLGAILLLLAFMNGCASLGRPRIDPSGKCLLTWDDPPTSSLSEAPPFISKLPDNFPSVLPPVNSSVPSSSGGVSPTDAPTAAMPGFSPVVPGTGRSEGVYQSSAAAPKILGQNKTAIVPTDNVSHEGAFFLKPGSVALPTGQIRGPAVLITAEEQVVPVGTDVVLIGSFLGADGFLRKHKRIEWSINGTGSIMDVSRSFYCDWIGGQFEGSKKVSDRYAFTTTAPYIYTLDRGTPSTHDDINILAGQAWISVNSTMEGTSHVSVLAPGIGNWQQRTTTAKIHWVDVQWLLPRASINPAGETKILTTTLRKKTNRDPRYNWIVQYEYLSGPRGGFGPTMARLVEVQSDSLGQASTELRLSELKAGTSTIGVKIIRPLDVDGGEKKVVVASETIRQSWTTGGMLTVKVQQPSEVVQNREFESIITVENSTTSDSPATLSVLVPSSMKIVAGAPLGNVSGNTAIWNIDNVPARGTYQVRLRLLAVSPDSSTMLEAKVVPRRVPAVVRPENLPNTRPIRPEVNPSQPGTRAPGDGTADQTPVVRPPSNGTSTPPQPSQTSRVTVFIDGPREIRVGQEKCIYDIIAKNNTGRTALKMKLVLLPPEDSQNRDVPPMEMFQATRGYDENWIEQDVLLKEYQNIENNQTVKLSCEFKALRAATRVRLQAEVWDEHDKVIARSEPFYVKISP